MNIFDPSISGSLSVSGSGQISGDLTVLGVLYATVSGTTQNAVSASHAAAYTLTSSFHQFTSSYTTGTFTGSFSGDGAGLYNIPASGVTGLNLSQISQGNATASITQANGLLINTNTEITGNLTVTGRLTAQEYHTELVSASIIYESGSSKFGDTLDDTHQITGSVDISGSLKVNNVVLATDRLVNVLVADAGGKYFIDGVRNPILTLIKGYTYKFLYSNVGAHPFKFSTTNDGTHNGGTAYSTGVTTGSTPDYIQIEVTNTTPSTLYYFCTSHPGMGNSISVVSDILNLETDRAVVYIEPARIATTGSNSLTGSQIISGSLSVTGSVDITGSITLNGQPIGTGKLDETVFNSYTSSNNTRVSGIEVSTGSLNSFTSSIDTTIKNKMNSDGVVSGSLQINITGTDGYTTFSSSLATTDFNQDNRLSSLETSSGSLNSFTSSASSRLNSLENASGSIRTDFNSYTSSNDSTNTTQNNRLSALESTTSSLNTFTSSAINSLSSIETSTGSINTFTSSANSRLVSLESASSSIRNDFNSYTSSNDSTNTTQNGRLNALESTSGSLNIFTSSANNRLSAIESTTSSINSFTTSAAGNINSLENASSSIRSDFNSYTSSNNTTNSTQNNRLTAIETSTSSLNSFTSSIDSTIKTKLNAEGVISGSAQVNISSTIGYSTFSSSLATTDANQDGRLSSLEGKTGSYATTGSNIFQGNQTITGSLFISQDLIVAGSSSIQHISSSIVNIADNIITVNAQNPSIRFGGLAVIDSGSSPQVSGSMLFDSTNDQWIFVHQNQSTITSSVLIMGPQTYNSLGSETYPTTNTILKSLNAEHIGDSNITDTGTKVSINSNTEVTGTLVVTQNISSPNISAIQTATGSLNSFTSSLLTAIELTGSNLTVKGNLLVKGTTTNVNTTTLDVDNNLINLNGTGASFAGLRVKDTTAPNQISGSLLWDATNDYWIAGQLGSEQRLVRETEFNNAVTRISNVETSTGSLNSFTGSINTTIKTRLNTEGVISGSSQVNHNATFNYDANQHIDHTAVSITAGSGLSGGGTIAASRTLSIATGGVTNAMLVNSAITIAGTSTSLGGSISAATILSSTGVVSGSAQLTSTFVQKSGDSMTGQLVIGSTGSGNAATLKINTSTAATFIHSQENFAANMTSGQTNILVVGSSGSTKNSGYIGYNWVSAGSNSNYVSFGHWGADHLFRIYGDGTVYMGTVTTGVWNGTSIGTAYTDAKITSVTGTANQVTVSASTGAVTFSLPQDIHTSATPTFGGLTSTGRVQIGGTDSRGVLTVQTGSTQTFTANTDPTDAGRFFVMQNTSTTNAAGQYSNITLQINPGGTIGTGRVLGDIRLVRNTLNGTSARFIFGAFRDDATYKDYLTLDFTGASFAGSINGLTVSSGTITTGTWNGTSISTTYTAAKVTAVNAGTGISVDTTTGSVTVTNTGTLTVAGTANQVLVNGAASAANGNITLSLPQNIHTTASPTFSGLTISGGATSATFRNTTASSNSNVCMGNDQTANGAGIALLGSTFSASGQYRANGGYVYSNLAGGLTLHAEGANSLYLATNGVAAITINSSQTVAFGGNLTTPNTTSIGLQDVGGTAWFRPRDTSNNLHIRTSSGGIYLDTDTVHYFRNTAGTTRGYIDSTNGGGRLMDTTLYSNAAAMNQSVTTSATPTFGGLTVGNGVATGRSTYGITNANIILTSSAADATGYCGIDFRSGNNYPSDGAQIYFENNSGGTSERAKLTLRVENDQEDFMELRAGRIDINSNTVSGGGQATMVNFQSAGSTVAYITSGGAIYARSGNLVKDFGNSTYATSFSNVSSVTVTHNLGSKDVMVMVYDSNDEMFWPSSIVTTSTSVVTITFAANRTGRVVVLR